MLADQMRDALERRRQRGMLRALSLHDTTARRAPQAPAPLMTLSSPGSSSSSSSALADFSSNDYLSLASSEEMRAAFVRRVVEAPRSPLGSTGSRLLDGNSVEHEELEHRLATFFHSPTALFFGSGFEANVSLFSTLPQPDDVIFFDELIHASVHDGMRQSRTAPERRLAFRHNDLGDLERLLRGHGLVSALTAGTVEDPAPTAQRSRRERLGQPNVFIAVEAVYSMDGDLCPLPELVALARRYVPPGCLHIIVDEAHSTGLYGPGGRGLCVEFGLVTVPPAAPTVPSHSAMHMTTTTTPDGVHLLRLATFGKACGASGAVVLCDALVRTYLYNYARPFIFSTAPAQAVLMAAHSAIDMLERDEVGGRRRRVLVERTEGLLCGLRKVVEYAAVTTRELQARQAGQGTTVAGDDLEQPRRPLLALVPALRLDHAQDGSSRRRRTSSEPHDGSSTSTSVPGTLPPSPIVPLLTPHPRPLAAHLQAQGFLVRPITYPTVPLGQDRVRICVHAGNGEEEVRGLVRAVRGWVDRVCEGRGWRLGKEEEERVAVVEVGMREAKEEKGKRSSVGGELGAAVATTSPSASPSPSPRLPTATLAGHRCGTSDGPVRLAGLDRVKPKL